MNHFFKRSHSNPCDKAFRTHLDTTLNTSYVMQTVFLDCLQSVKNYTYIS